MPRDLPPRTCEISSQKTKWGDGEGVWQVTECQKGLDLPTDMRNTRSQTHPKHHNMYKYNNMTRISNMFGHPY
eukprot:4593522-Amphidinium_carterae.1